MQKKWLIVALVVFLIACKPVKELSDEDEAALESCDDLGSENEIKECKYIKSVEIGYAAYCYELGEEKNECLTRIAEEKQDNSVCSYIKDGNKEAECYKRAAFSAKNVTMCHVIIIEKSRNNCINDFAVKFGNYTYCDSFYDSIRDASNIGFNRDNCVYNLINATNDKQLCKKIKSLQIKERPLCR